MNLASLWRRLSGQEDAPADADAAAPAWLVRGFVGLNVLAVVLIVALTGFSLTRSRNALLERANVTATSTAHTVEQAIASEIDQIDLLLRASVLAIERERRTGEAGTVVLRRVVQGSRTLLPHLQALHATDARGHVRVGDGETPAPAPSVGDREYFLRARDSRERTLVVSEPLMNPATGSWAIVFAHRLEGPDGAFAGIVYATLATARFEELLSSVRLGLHSEVALRTRSLRLVARNPAADPGETGSDRVSSELREVVARRADAGFYTATSRIDGIERRNAYIAVEPYPFLIVIGLSVEEMMTAWHREVRAMLALAAVTLLAVSTSSWLLRQAWRSESRHAAERLREADRHRAWLRTAGDGIHLVDREGRLVEYSDSFAAMLGYEPEQMAGMNVTQWEAAPPETAAHWCRTTQGDHRFKTRHRRADGTEIDVEVSTTTARLDGQELIFCASRDITERRRLEADARRALEAARRSEQRVREIADNVPAGITYVDRDERMQFVNAELARWLGRSVDELVGRPIREVLNAERYARRQAPYAAVWRGETVRVTELIPSRRGNVRHVETVLVPKRDEAGAVVGFYSLSQDRTERIRLESTLERQARNLAAMTSINDDIMVVLDEHGTILLANRAFEDAWQLAPGGAAGRSIAQLYGEGFFHEQLRPRLRLALDGQRVKVRTAYALPGQRLRVFDAGYHPVYNEQGLIDAVVFTAHDVDDLVHSRDELAHTVEQLQRSNESLEQFVRVTSHDVREPLNSIVQFVRLIEERGPLAPPTDRYFGFVRRGAERLRTMLDDLLRFVRLEAAVDPDDAHQLDDVLQEVQHALHAQLLASGGRVHCDPLPLVLGRRSLLVLLFQNLVSNALKFTPPGVPPEVRVSAERVGGRVRVTVADRGIGIAAQDIPTLFEPFRRLHRRQVYEGTGLGLATCKRIAMVLGGSIEIASTPGEGTQVTVDLPAA